MTSDSTILRKLTPADIPAALTLSSEAGWNQTAEDWQTLVELSPHGCLAIEVDGEVASTATLTCYGQRLAWIGMVLTRIKYRGRGFAMRLLNETLRLADDWEIESVKLDATDLGQPLYEKLGFHAEQPVERWWREGNSASDESRTSPDFPGQNWHAADRAAFGADRSDLLAKLAQRKAPLAEKNAFLLTRPGRTISYLGPCISDNPATALHLLHSVLQSASPGGWFWDLLLANQPAVTIAQELGFTPKRHLLRMVRGKDLRGYEQNIYALAGF
ncbi:MAG TPA: GNAT family N-acetyltransferase, partial [Terriglobales bacterium]|nr:GNAT family N-acetyltransferase [Terriglobales bacterium]